MAEAVAEPAILLPDRTCPEVARVHRFGMDREYAQGRKRALPAGDRRALQARIQMRICIQPHGLE